MKEKKYAKIIEYIYFAALVSFFAVITFVLFYNQAVNGIVYHESGFTIDRFHSDMYAYMQEMQGLDSGYSFPYPVFFKLSALINLVATPTVSVALATCILNTLAVVFSKIVLDRVLFDKEGNVRGLDNKNSTNTDTKKENAQSEDAKNENTRNGFSINATKLILGIFSSLFIVALFVASMLTPPHIYAGTKFRYLGVFSPNPFQNATYMAARPFAILSFALFIKLLGEYEENAKENIKDYILFAIVFLISTMTKPSFTIVLGATAVIVIFARFFMKKCKTFKASILLGLVFLPTFLDLLYQFKGVFVPTGGEEGGVGFCLGKIWLLYTDNMLTSIVFAMAFPLIVLAFNIPLLWKNAGYRFAWIFFIVSFCITFFFYEKGRRAVDFNFSWSYMYGLFFSFFTAIIVMLKDLADKKRRVFGVIEACTFSLHVISGLWYFAQIFAGNSYY